MKCQIMLVGIQFSYSIIPDVNVTYFLNQLTASSRPVTQPPNRTAHITILITFHVSLVPQWELVNFACYAIPRY